MATHKTFQLAIIVYSIWNIARYLTIGALVFKANQRNISDVNHYKPSCCDCYYISKHPTKYNLQSNARFDLSYCVPHCTDCAFCETRFNNSANASFQYSANANNAVCPIDGYKDEYKSGWSWNLNKDTGCIDSIVSVSSLHFFVKSYTAYGYWAITVTSLYTLLLIMLAFSAYKMPEISNNLLIYIFIYNFLISEICLYLIYKPFKYVHKIININSEYSAHCEVDTLDNSAIKDMLTILVWISLLLAACHICYILYKLCLCCTICVKSKRNQNRGRQQSINIAQNAKIVKGFDSKYYKLTSVEAKSYAVKWCIIGAAVLCTMLFFLALSVYATVVMIQAGIANKGEYDKWKISVISVVMILLFLSFVDSPLIWLKVYEKWRERNKNKNLSAAVATPQQLYELSL